MCTKLTDTQHATSNRLQHIFNICAALAGRGDSPQAKQADPSLKAGSSSRLTSGQRGQCEG